MADDSRSHDFDWVTALQECSVVVEFVYLRRLVEKGVTIRREAIEGQPGSLSYSTDESGFSVSRYLDVGVPRTIRFMLGDDCIVVVDEVHDTSYCLTLTLNDEGECRYRMDGGTKEMLRWQVVRRLMEPLLFPYERNGK
ncbi:MAG: hypothetical protein OXI71_14055 [Gemmatimonadota bacterium]|nr:hypothetical protein [Gemmatimonadota bacterium]